jgi:hypothetical protein
VPFAITPGSKCHDDTYSNGENDIESYYELEGRFGIVIPFSYAIADDERQQRSDSAASN